MNEKKKEKQCITRHGETNSLHMEVLPVKGRTPHTPAAEGLGRQARECDHQSNKIEIKNLSALRSKYQFSLLVAIHFVYC